MKHADPPLSVAWHQALASIRVRFFRQIVTTIGISLGIAFFCSVQLNRMSQPSQSGDDADRLKWLIGTSLVMCLVGVTNSMLMSVAERYREIGTIKCLGASDQLIIKIFFFEASLLGFSGSLIGAVAGTMLMYLAQTLQHVPVAGIAVLEVIGLGTVIGLVMTILAGIAPAYQAAKMPAAAALRVEV